MSQASFTLETPDGTQRVNFNEGQTFLEAILQAGLPHSHSCGGHGTCGTCQIQVVEGLSVLPDRNGLESELAMDRNFRQETRLACQTCASGGVRIRAHSSGSR